MRILSALTLTVLLVSTTQTARADGLIYRLPADGTSADFEMTMLIERNGQTIQSDGSLSIRSVGKQKFDDLDCRWIEIKMAMKMGDVERIMRAKVLVPEQELASGKTPIDQVKKAWFKRQDAEPTEISDLYGNNGGPLPAFLSGPFKDLEKLDAEVVESSLGKLECKGVTGKTEYTSTNGRNNVVTFTNRLHEKAPFGVVSSEMRHVNSSDGQAGREAIITIKLIKVGKNAKSDLPDAN